jgi:hypothetical protein
MCTAGAEYFHGVKLASTRQHATSVFDVFPSTSANEGGAPIARL